MNLVDVIRMRDQAIKNKIIYSMPPEIREVLKSQLDDLFKKASDTWIKEDLKILGEEDWIEELAKKI